MKMKITAQLRYLHMAPRKVRAVVDVVRSLGIEEAEHQLRHSPKRAAEPILTLLRSALANAQHNYFIEPHELRIGEFCIDEGPSRRRFRAGSRGGVVRMQKRTSHVRLVLEPISEEIVERSHRERQEKMSIEPPVRLEDAEVHEEAEMGINQTIQDERPQAAPRDEKAPTISKERLRGIGKKIFRRKSM